MTLPLSWSENAESHGGMGVKIAQCKGEEDLVVEQFASEPA